LFRSRVPALAPNIGIRLTASTTAKVIYTPNGFFGSIGLRAVHSDYWVRGA
jgi:hypothetical protein